MTRARAENWTHLTNLGTLDQNRGSNMIVNVSEAKAKLSKLLDMVCHGQQVTIAKNNLPVADLVPHKPAAKRELGLLRNRITVPAGVLDEDPEIDEMFYGGKP